LFCFGAGDEEEREMRVRRAERGGTENPDPWGAGAPLELK
jgi:hypothetical protein